MSEESMGIPKLTVGFRRARYECNVKLSSLEKEEVLKFPKFEAGGFQWGLAVFRGFMNASNIEMFRVYLSSHNKIAVRADVSFQLVSKNSGRKLVDFQRTPKTAGPCYFIEKQNVRLDQLVNDRKEKTPVDELIVIVDLKNIREATVANLRKSKADMRTVHLEVLDRDIIQARLIKSAKPGILHSTRRRTCDINWCSLLHSWAAHTQDCRYWLCQRAADGDLFIKGCLDNADLFNRFGDVSEPDKGGRPWVTLFKESKKSNESFQRIEDTTIVLFCELFEPQHPKHSYLGYVLVENTTRIPDLLEKLANEKAGFPVGTKYSAHLVKGRVRDKEITCEQASLIGSGVRSGSTIVLEKQPTNERLEGEAVRQDPAVDVNGGCNPVEVKAGSEERVGAEPTELAVMQTTDGDDTKDGASLNSVQTEESLLVCGSSYAFPFSAESQILEVATDPSEQMNSAAEKDYPCVLQSCILNNESDKSPSEISEVIMAESLVTKTGEVAKNMDPSRDLQISVTSEKPQETVSVVEAYVQNNATISFDEDETKSVRNNAKDLNHFGASEDTASMTPLRTETSHSRIEFLPDADECTLVGRRQREGLQHLILGHQNSINKATENSNAPTECALAWNASVMTDSKPTEISPKPDPDRPPESIVVQTECSLSPTNTLTESGIRTTEVESGHAGELQSSRAQKGVVRQAQPACNKLADTLNSKGTLSAGLSGLAQGIEMQNPALSGKDEALTYNSEMAQPVSPADLQTDPLQTHELLPSAQKERLAKSPTQKVQSITSSHEDTEVDNGNHTDG